MGVEQFLTSGAVPEAEQKADKDELLEEKPQPSPDYGPPTLQEEQAARMEEPSVALKETQQHFEELLSSRNPAEEIDTKTERERITERMEEVRKAKENAPAKEQQKLEDIGKKLEKEEVQLELTDQYNETLGELYDLKEKDPEEFESVLKTGKKKNGERLRRRGGFLRDDEAKALANFSKAGGMKRITWEAFRTLQQFVDAVLKDLVISPIKKFVGLGG